MPRRGPSVRSRGLGAELRDLRTALGLTSRAVAEQLGWSPSTLSRLESGQRGISPEDIAALLVVYKITGVERDRLLDRAREADQPGWWEATWPGQTGLPKALVGLIGFESQATRIVDVAMVLVPGLLQTAEYSRAVMVGGGLAPQAVEARVAARLGRQAILSRPDPPELHVLLDEAALRRPVGGPAVMATQLRHVLTAAQRPSITVQVLPFEFGAHEGAGGSFVLLEFDKGRAIVHLEHAAGSMFQDEPEDVAPFVEIRDALTARALNPAQSTDVLVEVAEEHEKKARQT
ncbi:helix-turn-helix domain-containing protein [Frankia sp. AgB1.9]|uniref:helix-turn-helix domain-containing protein n=1 Tax=unclassified Frankia TaxID=2632575 RepID=UPI0019346B85|nr:MULTISPECIES: helix-turn-helix transcriptional regulator [unclassified Frankia]MBL7493725.1 helix-turn-helix domain-containing protein [Frankia sp. AgW1.1]MBL7552791.1 helix-turn-helix domain-containing protein [Frankia sp. AgB1.9]MBL7625403.1 helix-turn-helix domain-containing protein [Frankia sp. AgB1.8]